MASVEPLLKSLPRLAYVGDVPVEASYHGSALLYRLMADYPTGQLTIVEAGLERSKVERRIENAIYLSEPVPCSRLNSTRFHLEYEALRIVTARFLGRRLADRLKPFKPEAIVTVSHGVSWIAAAHAARILDVPFHLICHDEWAKLPSKIIGQSSREELFGRTYRAAHSRLCVSPFMEENYGRRFGETGTVLYPSRDKLEPSQDGPQARAAKTGDGLICTFAGSINSPGYVGALTRVADELAKIRGQLEIFGPVDAEAGARAGLNKPNIRFRGMVPSAQLIETLRRESDILYVPMSFEARDRLNMELSFPSKLTDYTLTGLPLLISGPDYCSAVQWAEKYEGVAECVTEVEGNGLAEALRRLTDPAHRLRVGRRAAEIGEELFSYERAIATFYRALQKSPLFVEASLDNEA
ncbi:hypothetical protein MGEO_03035 [Marivita geojedonensis]|uniref:Glycosyltransferase subfamily 4-like N-terminal domain-containing protein n=2 Tax=Marivita geojedonensis TaxID=1123756 RepID=A0A1X4NR99_9RHOB|nr:hypothetical protein MGEO_03035 [Marivita geojedonensis]PRY81479.1 glycosyl transferase family 4 [Marivita geojedonensis]